MIVDGAYPNDIRVRKQAETLAESQKKVLVVCPRGKDDLQLEIVNNVEIFRIGNNYTSVKKGVCDVFESIFNINPLFYFGLKKVFKKYDIDYLHVHDLPLASTGQWFSSRVRNKIYLDLHENYPEALKTWFLWKQNSILKLKNFIFMNPEKWSKKEKKYCNKYDKIICVVDEMKEKLITNFGIDPKKMVVVSNHEKKDFITNFKQKTIQKIINKEDFSITYVGGFGPHRGLHTAIEGMSKIVESIPNAKLFLIGKGSDDVKNKLKEITNKSKVEKYVNFVGYRPFSEVATIMQTTDINIIPHVANDHTDNTIPHKLFQIMMSKSLLLVSSCKPLKRIVEKYDAGVVFNANDSNDFAIKVISFFKNRDDYNYKIENGYNAVMNKSENWEVESKKLLYLYDNLEN